MQEFLASPLFKALIAVVVLGTVLKAVASIFSKPKQDKMSVRVKCQECGWTGAVGKYNRVCSQCNSGSVRPVR